MSNSGFPLLSCFSEMSLGQRSLGSLGLGEGARGSQIWSSTLVPTRRSQTPPQGTRTPRSCPCPPHLGPQPGVPALKGSKLQLASSLPSEYVQVHPGVGTCTPGGSVKSVFNNSRPRRKHQGKLKSPCKAGTHSGPPAAPWKRPSTVPPDLGDALHTPRETPVPLPPKHRHRPVSCSSAEPSSTKSWEVRSTSTPAGEAAESF